MMRTLLLAPHNDDEALFAGFLALKHKPDLIVCLRSQRQEDRGTGITYRRRERETSEAWEILAPGRDWVQWPFLDRNPDWAEIGRRLGALAREYDRVLAPAPEAKGGQEHHDRIGAAAINTFGIDRTTLYLTYSTEGRSTWGTPVPIEDPAWVGAKLAALSKYQSQIALADTRPHFIGPLTEYVA